MGMDLDVVVVIRVLGARQRAHAQSAAIVRENDAHRPINLVDARWETDAVGSGAKPCSLERHVH
jgi:hypothetical protein